MLIEKQRHQLEHNRKEKTNFGQSLLERKGQMWSDSEEGGGEGGWCEAEWDDSWVLFDHSWLLSWAAVSATSKKEREKTWSRCCSGAFLGPFSNTWMRAARKHRCLELPPLWFVLTDLPGNNGVRPVSIISLLIWFARSLFLHCKKKKTTIKK